MFQEKLYCNSLEHNAFQSNYKLKLSIKLPLPSKTKAIFYSNKTKERGDALNKIARTYYFKKKCLEGCLSHFFYMANITTINAYILANYNK